MHPFIKEHTKLALRNQNKPKSVQEAIALINVKPEFEELLPAPHFLPFLGVCLCVMYVLSLYISLKKRKSTYCEKL